MNETTLRQVKDQIDSQAGGQVGQIKQKLINSLDKIGGQEEDQIKRVSNQIWQKTGMGNGQRFCFKLEVNGKVYKIYEDGNNYHFGDDYYSFVNINSFININGKFYEFFGDNGDLVNFEDWSKEVAEYLAKEEGMEMTDAHWEVINFLREYYEEYNITPAIKILVKAIAKRLGPDKGNAKYLYELFPDGPAKQACKIAGLPRTTGTF